MTERAFHITSMTNPVARITVETGFTFETLVAAFEKQLGRYDRSVGAELVKKNASWEEVSATIEAMAGPHGLMIMSHLELGRTVSLKGTPRQCSLYLVGNPLIASETADIRAGMLVPFRVEIYVEENGAVLSYDRPSSSLASLRNNTLNTLGVLLDEKMESLIASLALSQIDPHESKERK
jgi:uncharacterized protein (DUF302 family)